MHVVQISRDKTMDVSLIHAKIPKVLDHTKLGRDVTSQEGKRQLQIHWAINIYNIKGEFTTNSGIAQKINPHEAIKLQNIGGELTVEGVGAESQFYQKFGADNMPVT